jgi:hypothetical protein
VILGVDRHWRSILEHPRDLMAECAREAAVAHHVKIATADARGANVYEHPSFAGGLDHVNNGHALGLTI